MFAGVRESAGLGSPSSIFSTNMSESLNHIVKQHVHFKPSSFNSNLKRLIDAKPFLGLAYPEVRTHSG